MHLAAVYDAAIDDATGETQYSFCILTCGPSKEMAKIHTRMPVVLSPENARRWVDVDKYTFDDVKNLLVPFEGETCVTLLRHRGLGSSVFERLILIARDHCVWAVRLEFLQSSHCRE
jgi:putative SOS response-associated peptidase YedK